jgi:CHAT domain-containing protein/tetratricopeptide (TPR) repeat protein
LARPADKHLTPEELEAVSRVRNHPELLSEVADVSEVSSHLSQCIQCRSLAEVCSDIEEGLPNLPLSSRAPSSPACPPEGVWLQVLARLIPDKSAEEYIVHAGACDHCGMLLKDAVDVFDDRLTSEEKQFLSKLESSGPKWQKALVRRLSLPRPVENKKSVWKIRWHYPAKWKALAFGSAIVAILATSGWIAVDKLSLPFASGLLAEAYAQHRTIDMRFSGAKYGRVHIERGEVKSDIDKPQSLLSAEALIARRLRKAPNDPHWLQAKGRADLLDSRFDSAIESFERACEMLPDSPDLLNDLASAHFERAKVTGRAVDFATAIDLLGKAIALSPDDAVLRFNRAVANEQMMLYDEAIRDFEKFLSVEKNLGWAAEGKSRLLELRAKIKKHDESFLVPPQDPALAVSTIRGGLRNGAKLDQPQDELLLSVATTDWLPQFASNNQPRSSVSGQALRELADALKVRHHDLWLSDLLLQAPSVQWREGVLELGKAVQANKEGKPSLSVSRAVVAERRFRQVGSIAGELRAHLEYLIGLNRLQEGDRCKRAALDGVQLSSRYDYPWIQASLMLETATCYSLAGDPGKFSDFAHYALLLSARAQYASLHLRSVYYEDGVTNPLIASPEAWNRIRSGLREYWDNPVPQMSAFEFYSDLGFAAEDSELWHLAEAAGHESLEMVSRQDLGFEAATHQWLAQMSEMAGDTEEADREYQRARETFTLVGNSDSAETVIDIERAFLEIDRGAFDAARRRLGAVSGRMPDLHNSYASMLYHLAAGELHKHDGDTRAAEKELAAAVVISEMGSSALARESDRLTWSRNTAKAYRALLELYCLNQKDDSQPLAFLEWYRAAPLRTRPKTGRPVDQLDHEPSSVEKIGRSLKPVPSPVGSALLTWAVFPAGIKIWLLDRSGVHSAWSNVSSDVLRSRVDRFVRLCSDPASDYARLKMDGRQLYQWLVLPVQTALHGSTSVTIEPDSFLSRVPFSALVVENDEFWGNQIAIAESPGMAYLDLLNRPLSVTKSQRILAVGNPTPPSQDTSEFRSLTDAEKEALDVASRFERGSVLVRGDATFGKVVRGLNEAEVFHFAGHALSSGRNAGLVLSGDADDNQSPVTLTANDLLPKRLTKLRLAVLSGCETAQSESGTSDSLSLVRSFLRGGVPQVIASKWPVDSRATREIMDQLYDRLVRGDNGAYALSNAQKRMRLEPRTAHPYYWAAFSTFGRLS